MQTITLEYFENQLDTLYENKEDMQNALLKQYIFDADKNVFITHCPDLDKDESIECLEKLHINRDGLDMYMYLVKVDRGDLPLKNKNNIKLLEEFGLSNADIAFLYSKNKTRVALCVRGSLKESDKITLDIFTAYFNEFFVKYADECYEEVAQKVKMVGRSHAGDIRDIAKDVLMQKFDAYLQQHEVEVVCDIEREKSPFYVSKYAK
jgi:hypothetical protein